MNSKYEKPDICRQFCELTYQYLHGLIYRTGCEVDNINKTLENYNQPDHNRTDKKFDTIEKIYEHFLCHAQNKSTGGGAIRAVFGSAWWKDEINRESWNKLVNFGISPKHIAGFNKRNDLENALSKFYERSFNRTVKRYITTMYQLACWFSQPIFPDTAAVYKYFNDIYDNEGPENLYKELREQEHPNKVLYFYGMDALLRDALKEMGYVRFVKPDVHVIDIAKGCGIVEQNANSTKVAQSVQRVAECFGDNEWTPYRLDKYFFLIGSGDVYREDNDDISKEIQKTTSITRKAHFVDFVYDRLDAKSIEVGDSVAMLRRNDELRRGAVGKVRAVSNDDLFITADFKDHPQKTIHTIDLLILDKD